MKILVLSHEEVVQLLPMRDCIEVMQNALSTLARSEAELPLRTIFRPNNVRGVMAMMPSFRRSKPPLFGLKAICVFPDNAAIGKDAHQGGVLLFSGETGELLALVNASAITEIRTAAVSAVATRVLARQDAKELAIIGAGVQARSHLEAMACVRPIKRVRIAARTFESAQRFVEEMSTNRRRSSPTPDTQHPTLIIEPVKTAEEAVHGADIIVTATTSWEPVIKREWISRGAHINAVGTFSSKARELDTATVVAARLFVDRRESALNEAGDYILAAAEGAIGSDHIRAELGEVLIGAQQGRTSNDEITVFKSLGLAIEDLASAEYVYNKTAAESAGRWVDF
ncbi:MAG TPA: ornithine cyclodeaminase family protein [Terriglobales bacterium]|nr:ornithine cyclodeaminase family protein [Terriglobales bacterium]